MTTPKRRIFVVRFYWFMFKEISFNTNKRISTQKRAAKFKKLIINKFIGCDSIAISLNGATKLRGHSESRQVNPTCLTVILYTI